MRRLRWIFASLLTGVFGSSLAYLLTLVLISPAHSQPKAEAPSDGSLPAEFMKQADAPAGAKPPTSADPNLPLPGENPKTPPPPLEAPPAGSNPGAPTSGTAMGSEEYVYDPAGRRDPFRPYKFVRPQSPTVGKGPVKPEETLEPLQRFEIDQLTVLAILWDVKQPRALVRDGDGKVHTLVKNTKLGRNNGYVAAIREGEIVIMEMFDEEGGKTVKRARTLEFKKKDRD